MHGTAAEISPGYRRKGRLITFDSVDGRTLAARKVRRLLKLYQRELGRRPRPVEIELMQRCAVLQVLAEDARTRVLRGDRNVSYLEVVRADGAARRALQALQALPRRVRAQPDDGVPSIGELMARAR